MLRLPLFVIGSTSLLALAPAFAAGAEPVTLLAGRVDAVVAAGEGVAALREGEVLLLDADGLVVGGCRGAGARAGVARRPDRTTLSREEVLGEAGFSAEDVSPEAEELLDDEGVEPPARRRPVDARSGVPRACALAGTPEAVYAATADGLWRLGVRDGACAPVGLGGQELSLVAARGEVVVALGGDTVWRSRDAGATFEVAAVLTSPAHALALAPDGETALLADEDGVVEVGAARGLAQGSAPRFVRRLEGRVDALAACGPEVVALAGDGVHRLDADGGDLVAGRRPPVRALACGPEGLVAGGVGVWTSPDGAAWREETSGLGRAFSSVAWAAGRAWLGGERGLERLEAGHAAADAAADTGEPLAAPGPRRGLVEEKRPPGWAGLLPRVALTYDAWRGSTGVAGWRVWVLVTVSLGRRWQRTTTENVEDVR